MFQDAAAHEDEMKERRDIGIFYYRFRGGESGADVYDRVSHLVDSLRRPGGSSTSAPGTTRPPNIQAAAPAVQQLEQQQQQQQRRQFDGQEQQEDWRSTVVFVTHGLTARLFLMAWFNLTVDEFHGIWNLGNCDFYVLERDGDFGGNFSVSGRNFSEAESDGGGDDGGSGGSGGSSSSDRIDPSVFQMLHPIKAGEYPPPPTRFFRNGVSSTEPSTWGVTATEVVDIWLRHSEHGGDKTISQARQEKVRQLRREILGELEMAGGGNGDGHGHRGGNGANGSNTTTTGSTTSSGTGNGGTGDVADLAMTCMEDELRLRLKLQLIADSDVLPSEEASFAFLRDIVDVAYPRLVAAGHVREGGHLVLAPEALAAYPLRQAKAGGWVGGWVGGERERERKKEKESM